MDPGKTGYRGAASAYEKYVSRAHCRGRDAAMPASPCSVSVIAAPSSARTARPPSIRSAGGRVGLSHNRRLRKITHTAKVGTR
jgi:hypothetical protein